MIINKVMTPKKIPISRQVITFFSSVASGSDSPTTAIIKAMAVPMGMPLATKTSMMGTIPAALAYMGTARTTESGTANQLSFDIYCSKNPSGTKPCINAPMPIPIRIYSNTPLTIPQASRMIVGSRCKKGVLSPSHVWALDVEVCCSCFTQSLR